MKNRKRLALALHAMCGVLFAFVLTVAAFAQESRGTIIGRVADGTGAVMPGVKVEISNTATNVTTSATTNEDGPLQRTLSFARRISRDC